MERCENCNANCLEECQTSYKNAISKSDTACTNEYSLHKFKGSNSLNYSFTMNGIESCSHGCVYCSAATTLNYAQGVNHKDLENSLKKVDEKTYGEFKADFAKVAETFEHNSRFRKAKEIQEKQGVQAEVHIDLWGGDPVTNHLATIECVDFLKDFFENKHGMKLSISSSTGGLPLARRDIVDYYIENNITLQISHDGCGQWMRTGDIDPLYDDRIAGNIAELFNNGTLNMINDCLNFYNNDVFANKEYYVKYFKEIGISDENWKKLYIKLNRCYDGDYDIQRKNKFGIFGSDKRVWEELKGKPFGDVRHHNWKNLNSGNLELDHLFMHELDNYMNDWYKLALLMRDPNLHTDPTWIPFTSYIREQVNRWQPMRSRDESQSICRRFQMTESKVGDPKYWCKPNEFGEIEMFVIDTIGGYCECNLIDSEHHVKNRGCATVPEKCPVCKYYLQSECQGCGSEIFTEDCEWRYRWVSLLEQVKLLDKLLEATKKDKRIAQANFDAGYKKGREDERIDTGAAIVTGISRMLGLPGYEKSNNSNLVVPHQCNCKTQLTDEQKKELDRLHTKSNK